MTAPRRSFPALAAPTTMAPTATTVRDLLDRAHHHADQVLADRGAVSLAQWEPFDQTLYRLLIELLARSQRGPGLVDRATLPLHDIVKRYPTPLAALPDAPAVSPSGAARLVGCSTDTIRARIRRGELTATRTSTGWHIPRRSLNLRNEVHPADPTDPHPLARLAATLGALTDVLHEHQHDPDKPDLGTGPVNRLAHDVLTMTEAVARHTLTRIDPDGLDRVLAIAQHAASATARLAHAATEPIPYAALPPATPNLPNRLPRGPATDRLAPYQLGLLDRCLAEWRRAAKTELAQPVPSIEVIRNITSQSVHVYATLDALLAAEPHPGGEPAASTATARARLRETARELQRAGGAWGRSTTAMPPPPAYIDAAQHLHDTLEQTITHAPDLNSVQRGRALDGLTAACHDIAALTRDIRPIPDRLIEARALFGYARAAEGRTDRLHARLTGRLVALHHGDLRDLAKAAVAAETATQAVAVELSRQLVARCQPAMTAGPAIGPQL